jgi:hypothetical protein
MGDALQLMHQALDTMVSLWRTIRGLWISEIATTLLTLWLSYIVMRLAKIVQRQHELLIELLTILTNESADKVIRRLVD